MSSGSYETYEAAYLAEVESATSGEWINDATVHRVGLGRGDIHFSRPRLQGEYPDTHITVEFDAASRPGIRFGRRWDLYEAG